MNSRRCTDCLHPIPQAIAMSHEQLCVAPITHFMGASPRANSLLLFVAYVIHSKHVTGTILNRFVSGGIGYPKNGYISVVCFVLFYRFYCRAGQHRTDRPSTTVGFWHTRGNADVFLASLHEECGGHSFAILSSDCINNFEVVV